MPRGDQVLPLDVGISQLIKYTVELYICYSTVFNCFFLIPSLYRLRALSTLFTVNLKQKSLYLPFLSFQIPLQSPCFPNRKRSLFAPQGCTCLWVLSPSKADRPSAGGQGRGGKLLSPDSSALVFNPLVTRLPNQPGRGGPRGLAAVPGVPRHRGARAGAGQVDTDCTVSSEGALELTQGQQLWLVTACCHGDSCTWPRGEDHSEAC